MQKSYLCFCENICVTIFLGERIPGNAIFLRKYIFQVSSKTVNFTHFPLQSSGQVILRGSKIKGNVGTICRGWTVPLSTTRKLLVYCKMLVSKLCPIKWFISGKVQNTPRPPGPLTEARFLLFEQEVNLIYRDFSLNNGV